MRRGIRDSAMAHALAFAYPCMICLALAYRGPFVWMTPVLGGVLFPILDELLPKGNYAHGRLGKHRWVLLVWGYVLSHFVLLLTLLYLTASGGLGLLELFGLTLSFGIMAGALGFPVAHELIHSRARIERSIGLVLLCSSMYMHFRIEHVHGHHRNVGTHRDPATARFGESLGTFLLRSVTGQFVSAWAYERERVRKQHGAGHFAFSRTVVYLCVQLCLVTGLWLLLGGVAALLFIVQACIAVLLLETVNYIEHYGLVRRIRPDGRTERVTVEHSWNSSRLATNAALFNLGLHSHHHVHPADRYWELTDAGQPPELPYGYFVMIVLATIPPAWRRVMHPHLARHRSDTARQRPLTSTRFISERM